MLRLPEAEHLWPWSCSVCSIHPYSQASPKGAVAPGTTSCRGCGCKELRLPNVSGFSQWWLCLAQGCRTFGFGSLWTVARLQIPPYLRRVNRADFSRKRGKNPCGSRFVKQLPDLHPDQLSSSYPTNLIFPSMALYSREHSSINYPQSASGQCTAVPAAWHFKAKISKLLNQLKPIRSCLNMNIDLRI